MPTLTDADLTHLSRELSRRQEDHAQDPGSPHYDEGGPEPVMTSIGYVDLWIDGDVIANGALLATVDPEWPTP